MLLVIELNEIRHFCHEMSDFSIDFSNVPFLWLTKIRYEEKTFDHLHLLFANDIFLGEILQIETIALLYILKVKPIWKTIVKKQ